MYHNIFAERIRRRKGLVKRFIKARGFGILALIVLVFMLTCIIQPRFLVWGNIRTILLFLPIMIVAAMGQMMVIISGKFDFSIGSTLAFSSISIGMIYKYVNPDFPIPLAAVIIAVIIGMLLGMINGLLITRFKLPSIIVTIGTLYVYRVGIYIINGGYQIDPKIYLIS